MSLLYSTSFALTGSNTAPSDINLNTPLTRHPGYGNPITIVTNGECCYDGAGNNTAMYIASALSIGSADYEVSANIVFRTAFGAAGAYYVGIVARANVGSIEYYVLFLENLTTTPALTFRKRLSGGGLSAVLASYTLPTIALDTLYAMKLSITGNTLTGFWQGASVLTYTDTTSPITATGTGGLLSFGPSYAAGGPRWADFSIADFTTPAVAVTTPKAYQTVQRNRKSNTGTLSISGSISGFAGAAQSIEASFNGGGYQTIATGITSNFTANLTIPTGQGSLVVRVVGTPSASATILKVGCGERILIGGQSNNSGRGTNNQSVATTYTGPLTATLFGNDYTYKALVDPFDSATGQLDAVSSDGASGSWVPLAVGLIMTELGIPIEVVPAAKGGTSTLAWAVPTNRNDRTTLYGSAQYRASSTGGVGSIAWWQGESDGDASVSAATYQTRAKAIYDAFLTDLGTRPTQSTLLRCPSLSLANNDAINLGITNLWASGDSIQGPTLSDLTASDGQYHATSDSQLLTVAQRWARALIDRAFWVINSVTITQGTAISGVVGTPINLTATLSGTGSYPTNLVWSRVGGSGQAGSVNATTGVYTPYALVGLVPNVDVIRATAVDGTYAEITITIPAAGSGGSAPARQMRRGR